MLKDKLKRYRKARGWTQDDLAEHSGYSRSSIINWETGKRAPRSVDIEKLAIVLGVLPTDLISEIPAENQDISVNTDTLPLRIRQEIATGYAYWGGVLDSAIKLANSDKLQEIKLVTPLLKLAYEALIKAIEQSNSEADTIRDDRGVSAYNGHNSSYNGNSLTVAKA